MFRSFMLRGGKAEILSGFRCAVAVRSWTLKKVEGRWQLDALVDRVDAFYSRQRPLLFSAPRKGGFWCFPVEELTLLGSTALSAKLGPPEQ